MNGGDGRLNKQLAEEALRTKIENDDESGGSGADETGGMIDGTSQGSRPASRPGSVSGKSSAGFEISDHVAREAAIAFSHVDSDRSGVIDTHELMAALIHLGYPGVSLKMARQIIAKYNFDETVYHGGSLTVHDGSPPARETMSRAEFIAFVADSDVFLAKIEAQEKDKDQHMCGLGPGHAVGLNHWCKRLVPLFYLVATFLMLIVAHAFTSHKMGEHSVRAEMAVSGRAVLPTTPSASAMLRK